MDICRAKGTVWHIYLLLSRSGWIYVFIHKFVVRDLIRSLAKKKDYLSCVIGENDKDAYVDQLEDCPNKINCSNQYNTRGNKRHAIPEAYQAIQETIYVGQSWEILCGSVSHNSPKCWSESVKRKKFYKQTCVWSLSFHFR